MSLENDPGKKRIIGQEGNVTKAAFGDGTKREIPQAQRESPRVGHVGLYEVLTPDEVYAFCKEQTQNRPAEFGYFTSGELESVMQNMTDKQLLEIIQGAHTEKRTWFSMDADLLLGIKFPVFYAAQEYVRREDEKKNAITEPR